MLSTRAIKTIQWMKDNWLSGGSMGAWYCAGGFMRLSSDEVKEALLKAKKGGDITGAGKATINEIVQFHKCMNTVWGDKEKE